MQKKPLKFLSILLSILLIFQQTGFAQVAASLDISRHLLGLRNSFTQDKFRPLHLRYFSYDIGTNNFRILLDKGDLKDLKAVDLESSSRALLNYFLIGVTLPDDKFWVNLRPDSESNIIDDDLARTDIGKILLEADLQLKKDTARFTSPQTPEGKTYWDKLYKKAGELFGYENITIPTLTRPWIVPGEIIIRETKDSAYVYKATLKVLLEQDHLKNSAVYNFDDPRLKELNEYSSQIIREIIIPKLTKEVNISKRYAPLRQVFYSLILSRWFKNRFYGNNSLYSNSINRSDLTGLTSKEDWSKTTYFKQYQKSFKDGEYNIQESVSTPFGQTIRSYFSGGIDATLPMVATSVTPKAPVSPGDVNPGAFTGNADRNLAEVFIARGKVVGFEGKAGNEGELKEAKASIRPNVGAKDEKLLGSEGERYESEATFEEVFASGITVYSDGRFSFADQGENYQGKQVLKSFGEAALTSDEQKIWNSILDVFTQVFSRSKIFDSGQTFKKSFRLFEAGYNSTVFIRRVGNRTVFYVNRKWLQNLISLQEQLGHNGIIQEDRLPKAMRDSGIKTVNLIDSIIYAVAFHEIGGHHWDGQMRDDYGDTFKVKREQEATIQAFRGGATYGDFNTAAYRFYLTYAGIPTLNLDTGISTLGRGKQLFIQGLATSFGDLINGSIRQIQDITRQKEEVLGYFQVQSPIDIKAKATQYLSMVLAYARVTAQEFFNSLAGRGLSDTNRGVVEEQLTEVARQMTRHFTPGGYVVDTSNQSLVRAARAQHIGYVSGVLSREFSLEEQRVRDALNEYYDHNGDISILRQNLNLTDTYLKDNGWMFNGGLDGNGQWGFWGFGATDVALNLPGVYAGEATLNFANALTGDKGEALLNRLLSRSSGEIEDLLQGRGDPQEAVLAAFSARAAQLGWLVSKLGQGIVEAYNPKKEAGSVKRWAPANGLITTFDTMAASKGWKEVAKDIDQIRAYARHRAASSPIMGSEGIISSGASSELKRLTERIKKGELRSIEQRKESAVQYLKAQLGERIVDGKTVGNNEIVAIVESYIRDEERTDVQVLFLEGEYTDKIIHVLKKISAMASQSLGESLATGVARKIGATQENLEAYTPLLKQRSTFYVAEEIAKYKNQAEYWKDEAEWIRNRKTANLRWSKFHTDGKTIKTAEQEEQDAQSLLSHAQGNLEPKLAEILGTFVQEAGLRGFVNVSYRTKGVESAMKKLSSLRGQPWAKGKDVSIADLVDLLGGRIVVDDLRSLEKVMLAVERIIKEKQNDPRFQGMRILRKENKFIANDGKADPYRAVQYTITFPGKDGEQFTFELQLKTFSAMVASDLFHNAVYKFEVLNLPGDLQQTVKDYNWQSDVDETKAYLGAEATRSVRAQELSYEQKVGKAIEERDFNTFYDLALSKIEAGRNSRTFADKAEWIKTYDLINKMLDREIEFLNQLRETRPDIIQALARASHDNGYYKTKDVAGEDGRGGVINDPASTWLKPELSRTAINLLTETGRRFYTGRYENFRGNNQKLTMGQLDLHNLSPETLRAFFEAVGKDTEAPGVKRLIQDIESLRGASSEQLATKEAKKILNRPIINLYHQSFDDLLAKGQTIINPEARNKWNEAIINNQIKAVAVSVLLTEVGGADESGRTRDLGRSASENVSFALREKLIHEFWVFALQYNGEFAFDGLDRFGNKDPEGWRTADPEGRAAMSYERFVTTTDELGNLKFANQINLDRTIDEAILKELVIIHLTAITRCILENQSNPIKIASMQRAKAEIIAKYIKALVPERKLAEMVVSYVDEKLGSDSEVLLRGNSGAQEVLRTIVTLADRDHNQREKAQRRLAQAMPAEGMTLSQRAAIELLYPVLALADFNENNAIELNNYIRQTLRLGFQDTIAGDVKAIMEETTRSLPSDGVRKVERALKLAQELYAGQTRAADDPRSYFIHVVGVVKGLIFEYGIFNLFRDPEMASNIIAAALLHDVVEDVNKGDYRRSLARQFSEGEVKRLVETRIDQEVGPGVLAIVRELSKPVLSKNAVSPQEAEADYIRSLQSASLAAQIIKLSDWNNNFGDLVNVPTSNRQWTEQFVRNRLGPILDFLRLSNVPDQLKIHLLSQILTQGRLNNTLNKTISGAESVVTLTEDQQAKIISALKEISGRAAASTSRKDIMGSEGSFLVNNTTLEQLRQEIYFMWGELSDRIGYYDSEHYIFNSGDRKKLNTPQDIIGYAGKQIQKFQEDSERLTEYWEKTGISKAISTLRNVISRAEQLARTNSSPGTKIMGSEGSFPQTQRDPVKTLRDSGKYNELLDTGRFRFESIQAVDTKNLEATIRSISQLGDTSDPEILFQILNLINTETGLKQYAAVTGFEALRGIALAKLAEKQKGDLPSSYLEGYGFVTAFRTWVILGDIGAMIDLSRASPESKIFGSEGNIPLGPSAGQTSDQLGGIDFRAMNILVQPMGNFSGLDFRLPKLNNLTSINLDEEFGQIQDMLAGGIIPSGMRIKELIAACSQKEEINSRVDEMIICLADIFRLEEESLTESSPELKESLVILDSNRFILQ